MTSSPLFDMQAPRGVPLSSDVQLVSDPLLPQQATAGLLSHFFEEIYDLRPESHLSRLLAVLLGDAGVGQIRKRLTYSHLSHMVQTAHFYEIDRLFADIFGLRRFLSEGLDFDPATESGTIEEWEAVLAADASYRNRVEQFVRGIAWGPTPYGLQQVCSAVIGSPVRIYESFVNIDLGISEDPVLPALQLTYGELEEYTYGDIERFNFFSNSLTDNNFGTGKVQASEYEIGPGGTSVGSPKVFSGPVLSTSPALTDGTTRWYRTTPSATGQIVIDTSYSSAAGEPVGSTFPLLWAADIQIISGGTLVSSTGLANVRGRERVVVNVTSGVPFNFKILTTSPVGGTMDLRVTGSADGLLNPWNPYSPRPIKPSRTNFTVVPLRAISTEERYHLIRVLDRLKPVNSRVIIDKVGVETTDDVAISGVYSPSCYWSVRSQVIPGDGVQSAYARTGDPGEAVEQPTPAFSEYQGEEWYYNGDVLGVAAYAEDETGVFQTNNYERVVDQITEKPTDYYPEGSLLGIVDVLRGRVVRDGVLTVSPIERTP